MDSMYSWTCVCDNMFLFVQYLIEEILLYIKLAQRRLTLGDQDQGQHISCTFLPE